MYRLDVITDHEDVGLDVDGLILIALMSGGDYHTVRRTGVCQSAWASLSVPIARYPAKTRFQSLNRPVFRNAAQKSLMVSLVPVLPPSC